MTILNSVWPRADQAHALDLAQALDISCKDGWPELVACVGFEYVGIGVRRPAVPNPSNHHDSLPTDAVLHKQFTPTLAHPVGSGTRQHFSRKSRRGLCMTGRHARQESLSAVVDRAACDVFQHPQPSLDEAPMSKSAEP